MTEGTQEKEGETDNQQNNEGDGDQQLTSLFMKDLPVGTVPSANGRVRLDGWVYL